MSAISGGATSANISALRQLSQMLGASQKRLATGRAVASAIDDPTRYMLSERLMARSHQMEMINNNISTALVTIEAATSTVQTMLALVDEGLDIVSRALNRGTDTFQGTRSTTDINANTIVSPLAVAGSRLTLIVDGGQQFTYTFGAAAATTRWGEIVNAINSSGIGIIAEFPPATAPSVNNLRFRSLSGRDFRFGGDSDRAVIAAMGTITSGTGGTLDLANQFVSGAAAPIASQTGFTISFGGTIQSRVNVTNATVIAAGSALTFGNAEIGYHTWNTPTATTLADAIGAINGLNVGIIAELVNSGAGTTALRLRNGSGQDLEIVGASGAFSGPAGTAHFGTATEIRQTGYRAEHRANHAMRLIYGMQYDRIVSDLTLFAANVPSEQANLLIGQGLNVMIGTTSSMLNIRGKNVSTAAALGLQQAGATWTSFNNLQRSAQEITAARDILLDLSHELGQDRGLLTEQYKINASFSGAMRDLGSNVVAADMAEEAAKLSAIEVQQSIAIDAFAMAGDQHQQLLQMIGL